MPSLPAKTGPAIITIIPLSFPKLDTQEFFALMKDNNLELQHNFIHIGIYPDIGSAEITGNPQAGLPIISHGVNSIIKKLLYLLRLLTQKGANSEERRGASTESFLYFGDRW